MRHILPALFLFVLIGTLAASLTKPHLNWDLVMYIAAAKSYDEPDIAAVHAATYATLRDAVAPTVYLREVDRPPKLYREYTRALHADPRAFAEQLPFYTIRPIYVGLVYLLAKCGVDIVFATYAISGVAVALALALLYFMSASLLRQPYSYAVPFLAIIYGVMDVARASTPDGLALLAIVVAAYLYLRQRVNALLGMLPLTVLIRTDLLLFVLPLLLVMLITRSGSRVRVVASALLAGGIYAGIMHLSGNAGWATIFYHALIALVHYPLSQPPVLTAQDYFSTLFYGLRNLLDDGIFVLYVLGATCGAITVRARSRSLLHALRTPAVGLMAVCLVCVIGRLVLFPVAWLRYFTGMYMVGTFALLMLFDEREQR